MTQQVTYRDDDHTYWCGIQRYISATQVIDLYKNKFEVEEEAMKFADKHGATPAFWEKQWDDIREKSLVRGNRIHTAREELTLTRGMEVHQGRPLPVPNPALYPEHTPLIQMPDGVYTEQLLYHHGYRTAGRCDKVYITTDASGIRWADVDDYKSNRVIRSRGFCYKDGSRQMMKSPIAHLEDCSMVHYTLQISEYLLMLESMGFRAGTGRIIHFPPVLPIAPPGALPPPPVVYPVAYWKKDVISMLQQLPHG